MAGVDAFGTLFKRDTDGAGTFGTVANVSNLSGPNRTREAIEVTAHDSPDQYREFVKGLKDGGEVVVTINYNPGNSTHSQLDADFEEADLRAYQVVLLPGEDDEHTWDITGLITDIGDEFPIDDRMEREITVKVSGKPTLTATG
jgi:predicted secreted protein